MKRKKSGKYPTKIEDAMACIYCFLEDSEECQFSLKELLEQNRRRLPPYGGIIYKNSSVYQQIISG